MGDALFDFREKLQDAALGGGELREVLDALGLDAQELSNLPLEEALQRFTSALFAAKDPADALFELAVAFGDEGAKIGPTLAKLTDGTLSWSEAINNLKETGQFVTPEQRQSLTEMDEQVRKLQQRFMGLFETIVKDLAPVVVPLLKELLQDRALWDGITDAIKALTEAIKTLAPIAKEVLPFLVENLRLASEFAKGVSGIVQGRGVRDPGQFAGAAAGLNPIGILGRLFSTEVGDDLRDNEVNTDQIESNTREGNRTAEDQLREQQETNDILQRLIQRNGLVTANF